MNFNCNWSSLFNEKHLIHILDTHDARTFQSQIMWMDSQKASTSGYDGSDNVVHCDVIKVLRSIRKYHFDGTYVCFTKDVDNYSFVQHLLKLPTIQYKATYNLKKMSEEQMVAHMTRLHETQEKKKVDKDVVVATITEK